MNKSYVFISPSILLLSDQLVFKIVSWHFSIVDTFSPVSRFPIFLHKLPLKAHPW